MNGGGPGRGHKTRPEQARTLRLDFRVTSDEHAEIYTRATELGITMAQLIRDALLGVKA